jgi:hypothetical protein
MRDETNDALEAAAVIAEREGARLGEPAVGAAIAKAIRALIR